MSEYNNTKFYWLQLKEDFFEDDAIQWLEEQKPNGRDYAYFYLKLCIKSLKSNGILIRKVGNILIPYDNKKLAELTKMDFDTVTVAMELLKQIGLVKILENGEIYIEQLQELIGSKSVGAFKKQQQRLLKGQKEDKCPPKIEPKKDVKIEINKETIITEFESLWQRYPNKKGKELAYRHYTKARANGTTYDEVIIGLENYLKEIDVKKTAKQYIKHGSTWFSQHAWQDEYVSEVETDNNPNGFEQFMGGLNNFMNDDTDLATLIEGTDDFKKIMGEE